MTTSEQLKELEELVISKANGVFLWVVYVLKNLPNGLMTYDTFDQLRTKVEQLPSGIEQLYQQMWKRLNVDEKQHRDEASKCFHFILFCHERRIHIHGTLVFTALINPSLMERVLEKEEDVTCEEVCALCRRTEARLISCCAGLLERTVFNPNTEIGEGCELRDLATYGIRDMVDSIYRSASEFLANSEEGRNLLAITKVEEISSMAVRASLVRTLTISY